MSSFFCTSIHWSSTKRWNAFNPNSQRFMLDYAILQCNHNSNSCIFPLLSIIFRSSCFPLYIVSPWKLNGTINHQFIDSWKSSAQTFISDCILSDYVSDVSQNYFLSFGVFSLFFVTLSFDQFKFNYFFLQRVFIHLCVELLNSIDQIDHLLNEWKKKNCL